MKPPQKTQIRLEQKNFVLHPKPNQPEKSGLSQREYVDACFLIEQKIRKTPVEKQAAELSKQCRSWRVTVV